MACGLTQEDADSKIFIVLSRYKCMATQEGFSLPSGQLNLEMLIEEPTWKDILVNLIRKNELDPWNIDIEEIVDKYIEEIGRMKVLDLRVPANIILAASVLLRLKSETLDFSNGEEAESAADERGQIILEKSELTLRMRMPPKRKISLNELIAALDEAMKIKETRESRMFESRHFDIPVRFDAVDIEGDMERAYSLLCSIADKERMVNFSEAAMKIGEKNVLLGLFIPLLFLYHNKRIDMVQEEFFKEIVIIINN